MNRPLRLTTAIVGAAAAAAAAPSLASAAPVVTLDKPCYSKVPLGDSEPVVANITGGTPGGRFQLIFTVPGKGSGSAGSEVGTFDAAGNAVVTYTTIRPPRSTLDASKGQTLNVSVTDFAAQLNEVPQGSFKVTTLAMDVDSKPSNPRRKRAVHVSGTPFANQTVYGFITKPNSSKVLKKFRIGKTNECGYAERRAVVAPTRFRYGSYRLWINAGSSLKKSQAIGSTFRIFRRAF